MDTTRSDRTKVGLQRSFRCGKSAKVSIVCYGYRVNSKGKLQINLAEATHVRYIFERFATGDSVGKISDALFLVEIPSPSGNKIWSKETISKILSNEKYTRDVILGKTQVKDGIQVKTIDLSARTTLASHHPAIISKKLFDSAQKEKCRRCRSRER